MTKGEAAAILQHMSDGLDPVTGEVLSREHLCNYPEVIRALHMAVCALADAPAPHAGIRPNAGRPWTREDDVRLRALVEQGLDVNALCQQLQRRPRGLQRRMEMLGLLADETARRDVAPGLKNAGAPWYPEDDADLEAMFRQGSSIGDLAKHFGRTTGAIRSRLAKHGLIEDPWKG